MTHIAPDHGTGFSNPHNVAICREISERLADRMNLDQSDTPRDLLLLASQLLEDAPRHRPE
jgi:hypothetical protein